MRPLLALAAAALVAVALPARAEPKRIVVAGGDLTEIVYALHAEDRIVGVDTTSLYPPAARERPDVGYLRQLSAEGILSLSPDLVLTTVSAGPPPVLEQIRSAGTPVEILPEAFTAEGVLAKIEGVETALGLPDQGLSQAVRADFATVADAVAKLPAKPRVLFVLSITNGTPLGGGSGTAADGMIRLAGGTNAVGEAERYKPLSPEVVAAAAPELVVIASHAVEPNGGIEKIAALPVFAQTPAARTGRIIAMDSLYLLGFGPRTPQAVRDLAAAIHPGWTPPSLPDRAWSTGS
ncbi:hemin ABC transporter substrate-binding protein [Inquilinus sp. Marseille-Q2685]|uniref:heme/hemin ABC transporter substrate-binding protein n=1 Tax=Inquilinus sp. Marseille-Q2685 TaxID=2866581 RepID=UPI001CE482E2|nr:ABC transporter substrate-binding protein [Inquilinus sp. Marseille-Q2685]